MRHVRANAEESVRRIVARLDDGAYRYETDGGAVIQVAVRVDRERRSAVIDFTGTSPQLTGNANAPTAVVMAAVLYVFRTLVDEDIPLNSGCLEPLEVRVPPCSMLAPEPMRPPPSPGTSRPPRPSRARSTRPSASRPRAPAR